MPSLLLIFFIHTAINILTHFQLNLIIHGKNVYAFECLQLLVGSKDEEGGEKESKLSLSHSPKMRAIYLFEYLTRSSNNLSQLANQTLL